jgi:uncharacterized membrane protein required for colicin V production
MSVTTLDVVLFVLLTVAVIVETVRGFGCTAFDLVALYSAVLATQAIEPSVLTSLPLSTQNGCTSSVVYIVTFAVLAALCLGISAFASSNVRLHLGMLDKIGAFVLAIGVGVIVCHSVVEGMASGGADQVAATTGDFSQQILTFSSFYDAVDCLRSITGSTSTNS